MSRAATAVRFSLDGERLVLFAEPSAPPDAVYLRAIALACYRPEFPQAVPGEQLPVKLHKYRPDVGAVDLAGDLVLWVTCAKLDVDRVEHVLRHTPARRVAVLAEGASDLELHGLVARLRKGVHYRYATDRLEAVLVPPEPGNWVDPSDLAAAPGRLLRHRF